MCVFHAGKKTSSTSWRPAGTNSSASRWESEYSTSVKIPSPSRFCPFSQHSLFSSDVETLVGLPRPIHESVKTLKQVQECLKCTFECVEKRNVCDFLVFYPPQHKYVSIAEVQIKREEELQQCPLTLVGNTSIRFKLPYCMGMLRCVLGACCLTQGEEEVEETPAEILYLGMLPNLSQFVVSSHSSSCSSVFDVRGFYFFHDTI